MDREKQIQEFLKKKSLEPDVFYCKALRVYVRQSECRKRRSKKPEYQDRSCINCRDWKFYFSDESPPVVTPRRIKRKCNIGRAPFGYTKCGNRNLINPDEIDALRLLVRLKEGERMLSSQKIADRLNASGFKRRNETPFNAMSVRNTYLNYKKNKKKK